MINLVDLNDVAQYMTAPPQGADPHSVDLQPTLNSMMRCPLPPVNVTPDTTRQFYRGGMLPQIRVMSPPNAATSGAGSGGTSTSGAISSSSSTTVSLTVKQIAITTGILNPNENFSGVVALGKVFELIQMSSSTACRVRLYGTQNALNLDLSRPIDVAPAFGTEQGLILDSVLDSSPFTFALEGISGSSGDAPQSDLIYIAVTNVGSATTPISVTFSYLPFVT